jgi:hypothetical protein
LRHGQLIVRPTPRAQAVAKKRPQRERIAGTVIREHRSDA